MRMHANVAWKSCSDEGSGWNGMPFRIPIEPYTTDKMGNNDGSFRKIHLVNVLRVCTFGIVRSEKFWSLSSRANRRCDHGLGWLGWAVFSFLCRMPIFGIFLMTTVLVLYYKYHYWLLVQ
jgi:hypothetical protein